MHNMSLWIQLLVLQLHISVVCGGWRRYLLLVFLSFSFFIFPLIPQLMLLFSIRSDVSSSSWSSSFFSLLLLRCTSDDDDYHPHHQVPTTHNQTKTMFNQGNLCVVFGSLSFAPWDYFFCSCSSLPFLSVRALLLIHNRTYFFPFLSASWDVN